MYTDFGRSDWNRINRFLDTMRHGSDGTDSRAYVEAALSLLGILDNCRPYEGSGGTEFLRMLYSLHKESDSILKREVLEPLREIAELMDRHPDVFGKYAEEKSLVGKLKAVLKDSLPALREEQNTDADSGSGQASP